MAMQSIAVQPLTRASFQPFGDVIECDGAEHFEINDGFATRFHDLAALDVQQDAGRPLLNVFRARSRQLPLTIEMMERHPLGSQAFVPLGNLNWLVVVAPADDRGDPKAPVGFHPSAGQGVNYARGVWHYPLIALEAGDFVVVDRGGEGDNLAIHSWAEPIYQLTG